MVIYRIEYEKNGYHKAIDEDGNKIGFFISKKVYNPPVFEVGAKYDLKNLYKPDEEDSRMYYTAKSSHIKVDHLPKRKVNPLEKRDNKRVDAAKHRCKYGFNNCIKCEMDCYRQANLGDYDSITKYAESRTKEILDFAKESGCCEGVTLDESYV